MVRDHEPIAESLQDVLDRHRLGLGRRTRPAVGIARDLRGRSLVVVVPLLVVVAIQVDAIADRDLAVAVVVAKVLAPEPLGVERVLIAVRVRHEDEPELARVDEVRHLGVLAVVVDEVMEETAVDLGRDPLARMDGRHVEDVRSCPVCELFGVLGHLEGDDLPPLSRVADHLELHERGILPRELVELVANPSLFVPRPPDGEAVGCLLGSLLLHGQAVLVSLELEPDPLGRDAVAGAGRQDEVDAHAARDLLRRRDVEALAGELGDCGSIDRCCVHLELALVSGRSPIREGEGGHEHRNKESCAFHLFPLARSSGLKRPAMMSNSPNARRDHRRGSA